MQPVHVPHPLIAEHRRPVQVDDQSAVPLRELVDEGEQLLHPRPEALHHRAVTARTAHQHQASAGRRQPLHGLFQQAADPPHVDLGPERVVQPADECHHVRRHVRGGLHLLLDDLADQLAAYGEIRVPEAGGAGGQSRGEQVGPAAVRAVGEEVGHTLGEGVADRDKTGVVGIHLHGEADRTVR